MASADVAVALAGLHAGRARLNALPLHTLPDADLLAVLREQEADARRSAVSQHPRGARSPRALPSFTL